MRGGSEDGDPTVANTGGGGGDLWTRMSGIAASLVASQTNPPSASDLILDDADASFLSSDGVPDDDALVEFAPLWRLLDTVGEAESAPDSSSVWTDPSPALMRVAAPNADTIERRREKNRECMRRSRQRQREGYDRLKATAARLEKQYAQLCSHESTAVVDKSVVAGAAVLKATGGSRLEGLQQQYLVRLGLAKRLRAENLYLKERLTSQADWKRSLLRILESHGEWSGLPDVLQSPRGSPCSSPSSTSRRHDAPLSRPVALNFDVMDAQEANAVFLFTPLDEATVAATIVENAHQSQQIWASVMAAADAKEPGVMHQDVLGWDIVQRVRGSYVETVFTKTFTDLDVFLAGQNMWMNDMQLDSFRRVAYNLHRLDVLQRISTNTYVLGRDVKSPDSSIVFRSLFMRFRTQIAREIPNGSAPPLRATGFVIGSHSLNREWSSTASLPPYRSYRPGDGSDRPEGLRDDEALEWTDFVYATEFLTITDPATGECTHHIRWMGRSDYKSHSEALRNAPDALTVCLRTEMLLFRPAFELPTLRSSEA